ncbi:tRNA (guanosine(46)-N7)-methyltransferase TrmB [Fimbriiglobus ruber]|uniref:tRNA (guanosine(46)-N7)-methyltransferase TrmB n=1 Tax=Fimbriiglobus ruber TaxID=1908690 RepID=UPI000B4B5CA9|nr:tRNA (guanosine(46)-N7)-methyltransferase TrmB [Fimbriiglobus ruber]
MRKPRRLSPEELAPYLLEIPAASPSRPPSGKISASTSDAGPAPPDVSAPESVETNEPPRSIDWAALFGNGNPVELEVGFGKGLFLVNAGASRPDRNFFGIEIVRKYQLFATTRIALRQLANVKTCCADAKRVLHDFVRPGSVDTVHVFFPDPWWKNKHKKRLLFTPDFATDVLNVLKLGGRLHFVSDVADYFEMVTGTLAGLTNFRRLAPPDANEPAHDMDYLTNFERKFRKEGRPIYRSMYEKVD